MSCITYALPRFSLFSDSILGANRVRECTYQVVAAVFSEQPDQQYECACAHRRLSSI